MGALTASAEKFKVAFTFDDGFADHYVRVAPLLEKYGFRGTFNLITDRIGSGTNYMVWAQAKNLARRGHAIENHTKSHFDLRGLAAKGKADVVRRQIVEANEIIAREIGTAPRMLCYPFSKASPETDAAIRAAGLRVMNPDRRNFGGAKSGAVAYIRQRMAEGAGYADLLTHGIDKNKPGWCPFDSAEVFEEHLRSVKALVDAGEVEVVLYRDIPDAILQRKTVAAARPQPPQTSKQADGSRYSFAIESNHPDGLARLGEPTEFTIRVTENGAVPTTGGFGVSMDNFGSEPVMAQTSCSLATGNVFVVRGVLDKPGFLRMRIGSAKGMATRVVGYEPEKIRVAARRPADFDAFWAAGRRKLAKEVPLDPQVELVPARSTPAFDFYTVSFATFGRRIYGYMSVPKKRKGPHPALLEVSAAGFGTWTNRMQGRDDCVRVFLGVHPFAMEWNFEKAGLRDRFNALNEEAKKRHGVSYYAFVGLDDRPEAAEFYRCILGMDRIVDWIAARPEVDPSRFCYEGGSQGGAFGYWLAGLNPKIRRVALYVPAGGDLLGYKAGRSCCWPNPEKQFPSDRLSRIEAVVPYFEASFFAERITVPVRVVVGFSDTTCPPSAVYAAYNALATKDKRIFHGLDMGHGGAAKARFDQLPWLLGK